MTTQQRILIIEDEKPLREAFVYLLSGEGYQVESAENGQVGLAKLATFKPHLILLDMLMPVMNGETFLRKARLATKHPQVKTLMLSNLSDPVAFDDAQAFGITGSVLKADLSPAELAAMAKKMLTGSK